MRIAHVSITCYAQQRRFLQKHALALIRSALFHAAKHLVIAAQNRTHSVIARIEQINPVVRILVIDRITRRHNKVRVQIDLRNAALCALGKVFISRSLSAMQYQRNLKRGV